MIRAMLFYLYHRYVMLIDTAASSACFPILSVLKMMHSAIGPNFSRAIFQSSQLYGVQNRIGGIGHLVIMSFNKIVVDHLPTHHFPVLT